MSENFVGFKDVLSALSSKKITKTSDGKLNITGTVLSAKDFDKLYYRDVSELLQKYEADLSPDFMPSKQLYATLDALSSPVLKNTSVPEAVSGFRKKMHELAPDSKTLVAGYGTKYDGEDIINLANDGLVEAAAPMSLLIYRSLEAQDKDAADYVKPITYDQLLDFYSPEQNPGRLRGLLKEDKITPEFSELHQEMLEGVDPVKKKEYIKDIINESKENARTHDDFSEEVLGYANHQIIPDTELKQNITGEYLKAQYLAGAIGIARVLAIYETSPKYFSAVESILTPDEITKAHEKGDVGDEALMHISKESRVAYLKEKNTRFDTMMYLFLHCDGFSVTELKQLLAEDNAYSNLDTYIDEGSSPARIKDLYDNFLIDYACIKTLQNVGILSERDMRKYHFSHDKEQVYQEISSTPKVTITGNAGAVPIVTTGFFTGKTQTPNKENVVTTYKMLGAPETTESENIPVVEHKTENGKEGFLNKYRVVGLKRANLIAFVPPVNKGDEQRKPAYLMPYEEGAYIINSHRLPNNFFENEQIKEVPVTEKMPEQIIQTAYQFDESKPYLDRLGYDEEMEFEQCLIHMLDEYQKIKIKGEN